MKPHFDRQLTLRSGQQSALEQMIQVVESRPEPGTIIALTGISGVGKDALWSAVEDKFGSRKFRHYREARWQPRDEYYFTTTTPRELARIRPPVVPVIVRGMSLDETTAYLEQIKHPSAAQLAEYCLGIPLLAQRLMQNHSGESEKGGPEKWAIIAASHLWHSLGADSLGELDHYLAFLPTDTVFNAFQHLPDEQDSYSFRAQLPGILRRQAQIEQRCQTQFRSPFFVCADSLRLYDQMAQSRGCSPTFDIFAATISPVQAEIIQRELFPPGANLSEEGTRLQMFGATYRKVTLVLESTSINSLAFSEGHPETIDVYKRAARTGEIPLSLSTASTGTLYSLGATGTGTLYFHTHDHHHLFDNPLLAGMAIETLLQGLGIPYIVDYGILGQAFHYDGSAHHHLKSIERFAGTIGTKGPSHINQW